MCPVFEGCGSAEALGRKEDFAEVARGDAPWLPSLEPEERSDEKLLVYFIAFMSSLLARSGAVELPV